MEPDAAAIRQVCLHRAGKLLQIPVELMLAGADDRAVRGKAGQPVEGACIAIGQLSRPDFFCALAKVHEVLLVFVRNEEIRLFIKGKSRTTIARCLKRISYRKTPVNKTDGKKRQRKKSEG